MQRFVWVAILIVAVLGGFSLLAFQRAGVQQEDRQRHEHEKHAETGGEAREHDAHEEGEHDEHGHEEHQGPLRLEPESLEEMGIQVAVAQAGKLEQTLHLTGEIVLNPDRLAHTVPRVGGIVREVHATIGDSVRQGDVLAVLESSEIAKAKANYLGAQQRVALTGATLESKKKLQETGIVSELDFLAARRDAAEAEIMLRAADVRLHTYGFTHAQLSHISAEDEDALLTYRLRAPLAGVVVEKHITLGEVVTTESDVFMLADLGDVWVNLAVYQKDLPRIRVGQPVTIVAGEGIGEGSAEIDYISPVVEEATRTAVARATLPNPDGRWRPGLFVTGRLRVETSNVDVLVPEEAIQRLDARTVVFVAAEDGFEPRPVTIGRSDGQRVEITSGLKPGERYVHANAFTLKSELGKAGFEEGHAH